MFGGNASYKEEQFNFLRSLQHDRFLELQRNTGAYQGEAEIPGGLNRSVQHWLAVYSPEFQSPRFFAGVD